MAWSDEPTEMQLGTIFSWFCWEMSREKAKAAVEYLQHIATRRDVSYEMKRLKNLKDSKKLNSLNCFNSDIWNGFEYDD